MWAQFLHRHVCLWFLRPSSAITLYSSRCLRSAMRSSKPLATLCIVVAIVLMLVLRDMLRPTEELTLIRRTSVDKVRLIRGKRLGLYIYIL